MSLWGFNALLMIVFIAINSHRPASSKNSEETARSESSID